MLPILITLVVTAPIIALGTWLYLRRRTFSPRTRIVLMLILFLFILVSGPAIFVIWHHQGTNEAFSSAGRGGRRMLGQIPLAWLLAVGVSGTQLYRLCRRKGEL